MFTIKYICSRASPALQKHCTHTHALHTRARTLLRKQIGSGRKLHSASRIKLGSLFVCVCADSEQLILDFDCGHTQNIRTGIYFRILNNMYF